MTARTAPPAPALLAFVLTLCAFAIGAAPRAWAQDGFSKRGLATPAGPVVGTAKPEAERPALPPAIPGSKANTDEPAPAKQLPTDMQPTDALFDAINRGDIAGARDALNRGADFQATNILGMTPTELSVDLGRNDITFLLLSLRGASDAPPSPQPAAAAAAAATPPGKRPPARVAASQDRRRAQAAPIARASDEARPQAIAPTRRYAGDGGTPVPQAGFLGFGGVTH